MRPVFQTRLYKQKNGFHEVEVKEHKLKRDAVEAAEVAILDPDVHESQVVSLRIDGDLMLARYGGAAA